MAPRSAALLRARIERRADSLSRDLRSSLLRAYAILAEMVPDAELQRRIQLGLPPYTDLEIERALARMRLQVRNGVEQAGQDFTRRKA